MKTSFFEYHRPSDDEFKELWRKCIFSFDANVLLDLYRFTKESREELLRLLRTNQDRIWISHQAAQEFHENRISVISGANSRAGQLVKNINGLISQIESDYRQHPYITLGSVEKILAQLKLLITSVEEAQESYPDLMIDDGIGKEILDIFEGRVGKYYSPEELAALIATANDRYDKDIPPGFADRKSKDAPRSYGDCIIWFQLMDHAKNIQMPVVFVTRDLKDDWWVRFNGKTLLPRRELRREFFTVTGQHFYLYETSQFIQYANRDPRTEISSKLLDEAKVISTTSEAAAAGKQVQVESSMDSQSASDLVRYFKQIARSQATRISQANDQSQIQQKKIDGIRTRLAELRSLQTSNPNAELETLIKATNTDLFRAQTDLLLLRAQTLLDPNPSLDQQSEDTASDINDEKDSAVE